MTHRLTGGLAAVRDDAEALGKAELTGELCDHGVDMTDDGGVLRGDLRRGCKVQLGHDQEMGGRERRDVIEGIAELVLIDLFGRDLPGDDLAE